MYGLTDEFQAEKKSKKRWRVTAIVFMILWSITSGHDAVAVTGCDDPGTQTVGERRQCVRQFVNAERVAAGKSTIPLVDIMSWDAQDHSVWMEVNQSLTHTANLGWHMNQLFGQNEWTWAGEDIGHDSGSGFDALMQAFHDSQEHYDVYTKGNADGLGVGYVFKDGHIWITMWLVNRVGIS